MDLSMEELLETSVTSVSKKETRLQDAPTAITVIMPEDLRRIGATNVPEALRIVPGMMVGRINANDYAVSARGFNNQFANKLLVLVDGRSIYTPSFSGVSWNDQFLMLEDLERIEVIRGPGATLWGANAVNGVINISSKSAKDTQGALASFTHGTEFRSRASVRYGAMPAENLYFRVYAQSAQHAGFTNVRSAGNDGAWRDDRAGARLDWYPSARDHVTMSLEHRRTNVNELYLVPRIAPFGRNVEEFVVNRNSGSYALARWSRSISATAESTVQVYYDVNDRQHIGSRELRRTLDLDWQNRFALGTAHDLVWGLGYRSGPVRLSNSELAVWSRSKFQHQVLNAFAQDEVTLVRDRLKLTVGSKFEDNDITGFEAQPSARLAWTVDKQLTVWAAVSRAVRVTSYYETGVNYRLSASQPPQSPPVLAVVQPAPGLRPETLRAVELGYRFDPSRSWRFEATAFANDFERLHEYAVGVPRIRVSPPSVYVEVPIETRADGVRKDVGLELNGQWQATERLKIAAAYSWLKVRNRQQTVDPRQQFNLRAGWNFTERWELNANAYYVSGTTHVTLVDSVYSPDYLRGDLGLVWRPNKTVEVSLWGQNLQEPGHPEFQSLRTFRLNEVPRTFSGKITLQF